MATGARQAVAGGFADLLQQATEQVNAVQQEAEKASRAFALGETQSIHDTMITLERADLSLRLLTQIRNKAVEAYQEMMRMQI
jgi:flagellar hook-basal body complex protein FliE